MTGDASEPALVRQYRAWARPDSARTEADRRAFFTSALIVLDTNVLLDLYRYTPAARSEILAALQLTAPRLWLPYQVGLEFVSSRRGVIADRTDKLRKARAQVQYQLREAWKDVEAARDGVKNLLGTFANDEEAQANLDEIISDSKFDELIDSWRGTLCDHIEKLKASQDVNLEEVDSGADPILPSVAALFKDRVGAAPEPTVLRQRVEEAIAYRFPNKIPPGYLDAGKSTDLRAAGDYLLWEELIGHARSADRITRVLFVSGDLKSDWYQHPGPGLNSSRPWPSLINEFQIRANADILIMESKKFFEGIKDFLNAKITHKTVEEISRTAETREDAEDRLQVTITAAEAATLLPPDGLPLKAYRAAHLSSSTVKAAINSNTLRLFQWWLIGVTQELQLRDREFDEPGVDLVAIVTSGPPPGPDWLQATTMPRGEFPEPSSTWIAPWLVQVLNTSPGADRSALVRLAQRQAALRPEMNSPRGT